MNCPQILLLLLLTANAINAQPTITGQVLDRETKAPLPYVNIGIKDSNVGTVSDDKGKFELKINSKEAILVLSYIGYDSERIAASTLEENMHILLKPSSYRMEEVEIVSTNFDKELILGVRNEKERGHSVGFGNAQLGTELGTVIRIEKETLIKSVNFVLNHAKGDSLLLRVNVYDYIDGEIGEKVLDHNIYIKDKQRTGTFSVNLEEYEILLHNDVLLSLEWLRDFDESGNQFITFDTKKAKKLGGIFIRFSKTGEFMKSPYKTKYKPCIYFVGKQSSK